MKITIQADEFAEAIKSRINLLRTPKFMSAAGEIAHTSIQADVFDVLGVPGGASVLDWRGESHSWPELSPLTIAQRSRGNKKQKEPPTWPGNILFRTGNLRNTLTLSIGPGGFRISPAAEYGKYLNERFPFLMLTMEAWKDIKHEAVKLMSRGK